MRRVRTTRKILSNRVGTAERREGTVMEKVVAKAVMVETALTLHKGG